MKKLVLVLAIAASVAFGETLREFLDKTHLIKGDGGSLFNADGLVLLGLEECKEGNYEKALRAWAVACKSGNAYGCNNLGTLFQDGLGIEQDYKKAADLYKVACNSGAKQGCENLNELILNDVDISRADGGFTNKSQVKTKDSNNLISKLGRLYEKGDYVKAAQMATDACQKKDYFACGVLGWFYESGKGVEKNFSKARDLYELASDEMDRFGTLALDAFYARGVGGYTYQKAAQSYEKACELDDAKACDDLGFLYDEGLAGKKDLEQAEKLYAKACKLDEAMCSALGFFYEENGGGNSITLYEKACAKDARKCNWLAYAIKGNPKKSEEYMKKSCEAGFAGACESLFGSESNKDKPNWSLVSKYSKKACDMGEIAGCQYYYINAEAMESGEIEIQKYEWLFEAPAFTYKGKNGSPSWADIRKDYLDTERNISH